MQRNRISLRPDFNAPGLFAPLAPGPVVAVPGVILARETRTFGTGVYYSIYDLQMMIAPALAGKIVDRMDDVKRTFVLGSVMMILAHWAFRRSASPAA